MTNLSIPDVIALSTIVDVASQSAKVRWLDERGDIRSGVARHIVRSADDFSFIPSDMDVRDAFLRITDWGLEVTIAVRDLMEMIARGEFVKD
jgi:hypothetical protein